MTIRLQRFLATLIPVLAAGAAWNYAAPQQPSMEIDLQIDGKTHRLTSGKLTKLKIGKSEHAVMVKPSPFQHFKVDGIAFDYPLNTSFEHESSPESGLEMWTIEGADLMVLVFEFEIGMPNELAKSIAESTFASQSDDIEASPHTLSLGGKSVSGFRAQGILHDSPFSCTSFGLKAAGKTYVVALQDSRSEIGKASAEMTAMQRKLDETFKVTEK
jgi:hypothetical protein